MNDVREAASRVIRRVRVVSFLLCAVVPSLVPAGTPGLVAGTTLGQNPFWRLNEGWWASENTYFDGALNYNIRAYASLLHIELSGATLRQTEYKFYAPSKLALAAGRGVSTAEEGVETDTVLISELIDGSGTVRLTKAVPAGVPGDTLISVLTPDTALSVTRVPGRTVDDYRMVITLPTPDKRYIANFGIIDEPPPTADPAHPGSVGDLRGFSVFRQTRIVGDQVERLRRELRQRFNVHALVSAGSGDAPQVERLP